MLLRYSPLFLLLVAIAASAQPTTPLYGVTSCCPNTVVSFDPATGETTPLVEIGDADDAFIATVGSGVLDPATRQLYLVRNGLLVAADLDAGTVTEIGSAEAFSQFAGFDAERGRIYAFTTETEVTDPETGTGTLTNRLIAIDPADASAEEIAIVGEGVFDGSGYEGDFFATVSGPAIGGIDPLRLFTIRNFRLLTVALPEGTLTESAESAGGQLLAFAPGSGALVHFESEGGEAPGPLTYFARERDPATGDVLSEVVIGSAELDGEGNYEGDVFTASLGMAVFDPAGDRVVFNRNGQLLVVDLTDGLAAEGPALGNVRIVGLPLSATTDAADAATPVPAEVASYPNPFREAARLAVTLDRPQTLEIAAYDLLGRRVAVLHRGPVPAGTFTLDGVGRALPAGTYVVRVRGESVRESLRITRVD